ncbi:MAG: hypothetical protein C0518_02390 [Opitutus sp.]|nr:hypothetical protein [Opitutus sp.]
MKYRECSAASWTDAMSGDGRRTLPIGPSQPIPVMKNRMIKLGAAFALLALCAAPVQAKLAWNKKAKKFDATITACTACHVPEKPKKGDPLSERGEWLVQQKQKLGVKEVSLEWLKDYPKAGQ